MNNNKRNNWDIIWYLAGVFLLGSMLFSLLAGTARAQKIDNWDLVREGHYKVVVGIDTLQDDFNAYYTAWKGAYDYAEKSAQGTPIEIISPNYRFEYSYLESDTLYTEVYDTTYVTEKYPEHPYLNSVNWTYEDIPDTTSWKLHIEGNSIANEININTKCVGSDGVQFDGDIIDFVPNYFSHTMTFNCDEILTWDIVATTDTLEISPRKYYIDVAMFQSLE